MTLLPPPQAVEDQPPIPTTPPASTFHDNPKYLCFPEDRTEVGIQIGGISSNQVEEGIKDLEELAHKIQPLGVDATLAHAFPQPSDLYYLIITIKPCLFRFLSGGKKVSELTLWSVNQMLVTELPQVTYHQPASSSS